MTKKNLKATGIKRYFTFKGAIIRVIVTSQRCNYNRSLKTINGMTSLKCQKKKKKNNPPKTYQYRLLYPAKLFFKNEHEIKTFSENQRLIRFITNRPTLKEILRDVLQTAYK